MSERAHSANGIDRHRAQELGELACCPWIEAAIDTAGQARDIPERMLDFAVATLLKHERRHSEAPKLAGFMGERVGFSSIASLTKTRPLTRSSLVSFWAWMRTFSIWVCPALQTICDMVLASYSGREIQLEARHSPNPR